MTFAIVNLVLSLSGLRDRYEVSEGTLDHGIPTAVIVTLSAGQTLPEVSAATAHDGTHRARPVSARFEPMSKLKDVTTPVPRVLLSATLAGPAPSGSTDTSRLCQAAPSLGTTRTSRLLGHHPDQAALSYSDVLRQAAGEGLSPPLEPAAPHGANHQVDRFRTRPNILAKCSRLSNDHVSGCLDGLVEIVQALSALTG